MATAWRDDLIVQPARCLKHPKCTTGHFYCSDCNRVCCGECRVEADERFNHKKHNTIPLEQHLQQRHERVATIKSDVKKYIDKHDRLRHSISFVLDETKQKELQSGYDIIDELVDRLHRKVSSLQLTLKDTFKQQAEQKWTAATNARLVDNAEKALDAARTARAALEHEMRRAELDELHMAEGSREMDALADRIANFMQLDVRLPSASDFELRELKEQLKGSVTVFETDVSGKVDNLLSRVNQTRTLRLSETGVITKEQLKIQSDAYESCILGVVQPNINSLLFLDGWNCSVKILDTGDKLAMVCFIIIFIYSHSNRNLGKIF